MGSTRKWYANRQQIRNRGQQWKKINMFLIYQIIKGEVREVIVVNPTDIT